MIKMGIVKTKRKDDFINNKTNRIVCVAIFGLLCLVIFTYIMNNNNRKYTSDNEFELSRVELTTIESNLEKDFLTLRNNHKVKEETGFIEPLETPVKTKKFIPYDYWLDYNRYTGELTVINEKPLSDDLQKYIWKLCKKNNISFAVVMAQIGAESDFHSGISSDVGSVGLMQIRGSIHYELMDSLGVTNLYNEYENVLVGITLMNSFLLKYEDIELSLMAYNCGEAGASRLWNQEKYSTSYTKEILTVSATYEEIFGY